MIGVISRLIWILIVISAAIVGWVLVVELGIVSAVIVPAATAHARLGDLDGGGHA